MRRTNGLIVGACTALALAATAGAAAFARTGDRSPGADPRPFATSAAPRTASPSAPADAGAVRRAPATKPVATAGTGQQGRPVGLQTVGTFQAVNTLLGYVSGTRKETFTYPGAGYVKVHFQRLMMVPGDYVTVSDPSGEESYRYDAPPLLDQVLGGKAAEASTGRWAMSVTGDTAVVELHRQASVLGGITAPLDRLGVGVDRIARGYTPAEQQAATEKAKRQAPAGPGREESVCGGNQSQDAVCYRSADPVAYTKSKATARLLINATELCTGWRIGTGNRMITNNHCFATSDDAYETEVWFNYACAACGGYDVFRPTKVWGDKVLTTNHVYDFTLFTVENVPAIQKFGYLILETGRRPQRKEQLYVPQNPAGEPTVIAGSKGEKAGNCAVEDNAYDGYAKDSDVSYYCDTQGGSSGSPVISRVTDKVVALHHFGGCPNSGVRADLLWSKIKNYF